MPDVLWGRWLRCRYRECRTEITDLLFVRDASLLLNETRCVAICHTDLPPCPRAAPPPPPLPAQQTHAVARTHALPHLLFPVDVSRTTGQGMCSAP